tara:strand:- start:3625 stop:4182 length:558 start_codon:yes stop_codon:yes gene_type:complete
MDTIFKDDLEKLSENYEHIAILKLYSSNNELLNEYTTRIENHNRKICSTKFADSGFDLLVPENAILDPISKTTFINFQIKCEMGCYNSKTKSLTQSPYYIYPRSSISKTPLMLANHTGIIDLGYRGDLIGAFRNLSPDQQYHIEKNTRLLQICHPSLCPIYVVIVPENELSDTERGTGGFGSTGK